MEMGYFYSLSIHHHHRSSEDGLRVTRAKTLQPITIKEEEWTELREQNGTENGMRWADEDAVVMIDLIINPACATQLTLRKAEVWLN